MVIWNGMDIVCFVLLTLLALIGLLSTLQNKIDKYFKKRTSKKDMDKFF